MAAASESARMAVVPVEVSATSQELENPQRTEQEYILTHEESQAVPMDPDHILLRRAQAALKHQLEAKKQEVEELLREKTAVVKDARQQRENLGVELYGVQQHLARLQMGLERAHETYNVISKVRAQAEGELKELHAKYLECKGETAEGRKEAEKFQGELDKLAATIKQIEAYNEQMKNEIAVTRRATYVAEEAVTKLEKEKREQDLLIDQLQESLKQMSQQVALYEAQQVAQQRETKAARETLAEAEVEMEAINFEKKQLTQQWQSAIIGVTRRDEALMALEESIRKQQEQELSMDGELDAFKRGIKTEQERGEKLATGLTKVEAQAESLTKQMASLKEKRDQMAERYQKLQRSLEETEASSFRSKADTRVVQTKIDGVEKQIVKCNQENGELEAKMLTSLSEQTTKEKGAQQTAATTLKLRQRVREESLVVVGAQNELAKLRVDILTTQEHNAKLAQALNGLDGELKEKSSAIEKCQLEIRRKNDEIEKKTKEVDHLNKQYNKLTANMVDENMGPLEATIANIAKETAERLSQSKELQHKWLACQTELVALTNENNALTERVQRLRAEHTVLKQRRGRLDGNVEQQQREMREIDSSVRSMHTELQKLNELIAKNAQLRELLANENFNLETSILASLSEMEEEMVRLEGRIEGAKSDKREVLTEIVEMERHIMLWERKLALEKETQAALDPDIGHDVVNAMKKEIHRMRLRLTELMGSQERLISDMERSIYKRDNIANKGKAQSQKKSLTGNGVLASEASLVKTCQDLKKTIKDTEKEVGVVDANIKELNHQRDDLAAEFDDVGQKISDMRDKEEGLRASLGQAANGRLRELMFTTRKQRMVKRLEDVEAGKWKGTGVEPEQLAMEVAKAKERRATIEGVANNLLREMPHLESSLGKLMSLLSIGV